MIKLSFQTKKIKKNVINADHKFLRIYSKIFLAFVGGRLHVK